MAPAFSMDCGVRIAAVHQRLKHFAPLGRPGYPDYDAKSSIESAFSPARTLLGL
jgi:hypothetical protein